MNRTVALRHTLYERTTPKKKKKPATLSNMSPVKSSMKFDSTTSHSIRPDKLNEVERLLSPYRQPYTGKNKTASTTRCFTPGSTMTKFKTPTKKSKTSRPSTANARNGTLTDSRFFSSSREKSNMTSGESEVVGTVQDLFNYKAETYNLTAEKKALLKIIEMQKKRMNVVGLETEFVEHFHGRWHNDAVQMAQSIDSREDERIILFRAIEQEALECRELENEIQDYIDKNKECLNAIAEERERIMMLLDLIDDAKKTIPKEKKMIDRMTADLGPLAKMRGRLQLKYNHLVNEKDQILFSTRKARKAAANYPKDLYSD